MTDRNRFTGLFIFIALFFSIFNASALSAAGKLEVHNAWVREAPPNASVMAAYFSLHNHSTKGKTLISMASPQFKRVEMHRTEQQDGMTKMVAVSRVILDSKGSVSFEPGGMHVMLMNPKKPLKAGDKIALTLFFTDESSLKISLPVKKAAASMGHNMDHSMHDMDHSMHNDEHESHSQQHQH
jgi:copper(I)-binding protein